MLKNITKIVIIILVTVLSSTFFRNFSVNNVSANIFIITIVSIGIIRGRNEAIFYAIILGVIQDTLFGCVTGFNIIIYSVIAMIVSYLHENYYAESMVIPLSVIGIADIAYNIYIYFFTYLFRGRINIFYYIYAVILPEAFYTIMVAIIIYRLLISYSHWIDEIEIKQRQGDEIHESNN